MSKLDDLKAKAKETTQKVKEKAKEFGNVCVTYINEHEEMHKTIMIGLAGIIGGIIAGTSNLDTREKAASYVGDDVTGLEFHTKHPLNNNEIRELGSRMIDGQTTGDALDEMGLLKKERKRR